jgi:hypothetical protein
MNIIYNFNEVCKADRGLIHGSKLTPKGIDIPGNGLDENCDGVDGNASGSLQGGDSRDIN